MMKRGNMRKVVALVSLTVALAVALSACKRKPGDLEVWRPTVAQNGQEKLTEWVGSADELIETRVRCAEILIEDDCAYSVKLGLDNATPEDRATIVAALVPAVHKMYAANDATVENYQKGKSKTVRGKDGAYQLYGHATGELRTALETDLLDWIGGGEFHVRDQMGNIKIGQIAEAIGPKAAEKLLAHLDDPLNPQARIARILRTSPSADVRRKTATALKLAALAALAKTDTPPGERIDKDLMTAILEENDDAIVPLFVRVVPDESMDPTLRTNAIDRIAKIKGPAGIKIFANWIEKYPGDLRWLAVQAAAESGGKMVLPRILKALPASGKYGGGQSDGFKREAGRFCMVEVKEEMKDSEPVFLHALKKGTPPAKAVALRCLQEVGTKKSLPSVRGLLRDKTSIPAWGDEKTLGALAKVTLEKLEK
jgi:hypothetical protein